MALDSVTLTVLERKFDSIAREMGIIMRRAARSPIFSQSHDFSCFLADGVVGVCPISVADGIPIHTGGGGFAVERLLQYWGDDIHPAYIFLSNDPYAALGNHLPDWTVMNPVFHDGALVAFTCNRADIRSTSAAACPAPTTPTPSRSSTRASASRPSSSTSAACSVATCGT